MLELVGEFLDTTARFALRRWFPAWVRSGLVSVLMLGVAVAHRSVPWWGVELVAGQWLAMAFAVTLGLLGWVLFKLPFVSGARGRLFPWVWTGFGIAAVITLLATLQARDRPIGFSEWYAVVVWSLSQVWYLRESRGPAGANAVSEAFLLRTLYGVPVFAFTCFLGAGEGREALVGQAIQLTIFHAVMMWLNHRLLVRHGR